VTDYDPTIEDSYTKQCIVDDVVARLDSNYFRLFFPLINGFINVFNVNFIFVLY